MTSSSGNRASGRPTPDASGTDVDWSRLHQSDCSWRTHLLGQLSPRFAIPRYCELFRQAFADWPASRFLELGAGNGEITVRLAQVCPALLAHYVVSERFLTAAGWLRRQGLLACVLDARHIPFADCSFDAVIAFDVLHHVAETQRMAGEMARVARRRLFLVEANGLSLGRKAMELTAGHRAAGERSYTPWQYRAIFARATGRLCRFEAHPFLFPLPGGVPASLLASWVRLNRVLERVPLLRWQCSNVWIRIDLAD